MCVEPTWKARWMYAGDDEGDEPRSSSVSAYEYE